MNPDHITTLRQRDGTEHIVKVSFEDRGLLDKYTWHVGRIRRCHYVSAQIDGHTVYLHRLILGLTLGDGIQVDHINRNGLDNRRENLRLATNALNRQNFSSRGYANNSSGYRGVYWIAERQRWGAACTIGGKTKRLGRFKSKEEAHRAVSEYRRTHMPYAIEE